MNPSAIQTSAQSIINDMPCSSCKQAGHNKKTCIAKIKSKTTEQQPKISAKELQDISEKTNVDEMFEKSPMKRYIKRISMCKTISLDDFPQKSVFIQVADIVLDTEIASNGLKKGSKQRNTLIRLENCDKIAIAKKKEWIYLILVNNRIVKIGGTRSGIKDRFGSYLCGHHTEERGKSGKASETNKYVYNTLLFYLELGCDIKLYGYELPTEEITRNVFGKEIKIHVQTFHSYESVLMDQFKKQTGFIPFLCDNSDPEYKE